MHKTTVNRGDRLTEQLGGLANRERATSQERQASLLRMYADRWQTLTGKRQVRNQRRNYEEMLMNDLPGAAEKTNLAMHAVLESELDGEGETDEAVQSALPKTRAAQRKRETPLRVRNHALLHYFANLARSNNLNDKMDFAFVQSLIKNGASINTADKHGQTVFHEVARSWHTDVAKFLLNNGKYRGWEILRRTVNYAILGKDLYWL